jgi:hypothetical protein
VVRDAPVSPAFVGDTTGPSAISQQQFATSTPTTTATATPFDTTLGLDPAKQQAMTSVIDAGTPTTTSATTEIPRNPYTIKDDPFFRSLSGGSQTPDPILGQTDTLAQTGTTLGTSPVTVGDAAGGITSSTRATTAGDALQRILGTGEYEGQRNILGGLKDLFLPGATRSDAEIRRILVERGIDPGSAAGKKLFESLATRGISRFAPLGIAALGASALQQQEPTDFGVDEMPTGMDLYTANPYRYSVGTIQPRRLPFQIKTLGYHRQCLSTGAGTSRGRSYR